MKETQFIRQNKEKWVELEAMQQKGKPDPNRMTELFIHLNDDLSYARTFYPNRSIRLYLNQLAQRAFQHLYRTERFSTRHLWRFWRQDLPLTVYRHRWTMLLSFLVFALSMIIGVISSVHVPDFARQILGDTYVDMTLANIASDDPMAVYKEAKAFDMFLGITLNNVMVSFRVFLLGLLAAIGTLGLLLYNGIMVGTFQFFFIERGLFWDSFLTIWLHGTLEISAIIIAGGAGMVLGKGLLFPGTYSRWQAFLITARDGFRILMGTVPLFILAGFIEGFFTRYTAAPDVIRGLLILTCAVAVVLYFIVWPVLLHRQGAPAPPPLVLRPVRPPEWSKAAVPTNGSLYMHTFWRYRQGWTHFWRTALLSVGLSFLVIWALYPHLMDRFQPFGEIWSGFSQLSAWLYAQQWPELLVLYAATWLWQGRKVLQVLEVEQLKARHWTGLTLSAVLFVLPFLAGVGWHLVMALALWPLAGFVVGVSALSSQRSLVEETAALLGTRMGKWLGLYLMILLTGAILLLLTNSPLQLLLVEVITWNLTAEVDQAVEMIGFILGLLTLAIFWLLVPLIQLSFALQVKALREIREAPGLNEELDGLA